MSKILEKVVSAQIVLILAKQYLCEEFQSGFRPHHSTETALVKITNDLLLASDQGCISLLVLLDLSAAFDTMDHDILIDRLQNYTGIQGQALRWFRSFLPVRSLPLCLFKWGVISIITSKVWSTTRICPRSSAIFNTCCPLVILLENTELVSIVMLMILNYISQQDQMKLLNYLSYQSVLKI